MHEPLSAAGFYDRLAGDYHLLYHDWAKAASDQAAVLSGMLAAWGQGKGAILDCACGIGTQALGLAALGLSVAAIDISPRAVARARKEARARGLSSMRFEVADMRRLPGEFQDSFDVAICCDNPLAHLLTPEDLRLAMFSIRTALRPGGIVVLSSWDYDRNLKERTSDVSLRHHVVGNRWTIAFQIWEWDPAAPTYTNHQFILQNKGRGWSTIQVTTKMRAYTKQEIRDAFEAAGFRNAEWHSAEDTGYFQPIMSAVSPS